MSSPSEDVGIHPRGKSVARTTIPQDLLTPGDLGGLPTELVRLPRKLEIPPSFEDTFTQLRVAITKRVESLGTINDPIKSSDALLCLLLEVNEGVVRPGFLGKQRLEFTERMNELFGAGKWSMQHVIKGRLFEPEVAWKHYEDAYVHFFKHNPDKLKWLTENYSDVIDNAPSNVDSGSDYHIQEVPERGHHIHDIAIRRAVARCEATFKGEKPLIVRGKYVDKKLAEGYFLSPGEVPFHRPELIPQHPFVGRKPWWQPNSIEEFYQQTRRLVVNEFREDTLAPSNLLETQEKDSYLFRVAARATLRTLLVMTKPDVKLTEISWLPWMLDYNSFPVGQDGLPRAFTKDELAGVLQAAFDQLQGLFQKKGTEANLLAANGWGSFTDAKEFLEAIEADHKDELSDDQAERFPDISDIKDWAKVLPLFQRYLTEQGTRPLFLARDGLAIMEYLMYGMLIDGKDRSEANEALQHTIYLPGSPASRTSRNLRGSHVLFDRTTFDVNRISLECKKELGLFAPPGSQDVRDTLHALFESKVHMLLNEWRDSREDNSEGRTLFEWWFDAYNSIRDSFKGGVSRIAIVDSDGTGKTALFIRSIFGFFAKVRGDTASFELVLGALQSDHLGVKNILEENGLEGSLPDIRWPFRFSRFEGEPVFNVRPTPKYALALIYRTLSYYNIAVEAKLSEESRASGGLPEGDAGLTH
jgi:hypothetical protein